MLASVMSRVVMSRFFDVILNAHVDIDPMFLEDGTEHDERRAQSDGDEHLLLDVGSSWLAPCVHAADGIAGGESTRRDDVAVASDGTCAVLGDPRNDAYPFLRLMAHEIDV